MCLGLERSVGEAWGVSRDMPVQVVRLVEVEAEALPEWALVYVFLLSAACRSYASGERRRLRRKLRLGCSLLGLVAHKAPTDAIVGASARHFHLYHVSQLSRSGI